MQSSRRLISKACHAFIFGLILSSAMLFAGCKEKISSRDSDTGNDTASQPSIKKGVKPVADAEVAVIETENPAYGPIVIELYSNIAPKMVERFKQLAKEGFYNGTAFHRINASAGLIQGGDPLSKDNDPENDGSGNSPYPNVPQEFSDLPYERGTVGAARRDAGPGMSEQEGWNSANCQFFITLQRQDTFDGLYTVFGRVIDGLNNVDVIAHAPVEAGTERPTSKIIIKNITLQPRSKYPAK
ncbi:MAG TPA: peptidylprolyl isomerase [Pyrinomonadaceae bacterium]|jgi:cyclophilin family peptidyl-prolyl cis-trans isomerase